MVDRGAKNRVEGMAAGKPLASNPLSTTRTIRGSDGRLRPYDPKRIEEAVQQAMTSASESDPTFAREVSGVVGMTLEARYPSPRRRAPHKGNQQWSDPELDLFSYRTPTSEDLLDLVEESLVQMGRARTAKAFILDRDRRGRARRALQVHGPRARLEQGGAEALDVDSGPLSAPWQRAAWDKARLVRSLVAQTDLPLELAEEVGERIEERLVLASFKSLTPRLIDAFVEAELLAMGYTEEAHKRSSFFISRERVTHWMLDEGRFPVAGRAAEELIAPHAHTVLFEDVLPRPAVEAIHNGILYIENGERPLGPLTRSLPQSLLQEGPADLRLVGALAPLLASCSGELVLRALELGPQPDPRSVYNLLEAIGAIAQAFGVRLAFVQPLTGEGRLEALLEALAQLEAEAARESRQAACAPRLYLSEQEASAISEMNASTREAVDKLLRSGCIVPIWHGSRELWVGPGVRRAREETSSDGLRVCVAAVCLNLPRLARRAGAWREDLMFEQLASTVEHALEVIESLDELALESVSRTAGLSEARSYALTPVGLSEAVRILSDGELSTDIGARLLAFFDEATRRFSSERGLDVVLSPFFGSRAAVAFAKGDAGERRVQQARLFADMPVPELAPALAYESGFPLATDEPEVQDRALSDEPASATANKLWSSLVYGRLPSGAFFSTPAEGTTPTPVTLAVWLRLEQQRTQAQLDALRGESAANTDPAAAGLAKPDAANSSVDHPGLFQPSSAQPPS